MIFDKFKKNFGRSKIVKQQGTASLLFMTLAFAKVNGLIKKYCHTDFRGLLFLSQGKLFTVFISGDDYLEMADKIFSVFCRQREKMPVVLLMKKFIKDSGVLYDSFNRLRFRKKPINFFRQARDLCGAALAISVYSEAIDEEYLKDKYRRIKGDEAGFGKFLEFASLPTFKSFALRMEEAIIKKKSPENIQYIFADYYSVPHLGEIGERIKAVIKEGDGFKKFIANFHKKAARIKNNKIKSVKFKRSLVPGLRRLFAFAQLGIYLRDIRKIVFSRSLTVAFEMARENLQAAGLSENNYAFSLPEDFFTKRYLHRKYSDLIKKRKRGLIIYLAGRSGFELEADPSGTETKKILAFAERAEKGNNGLQGNIAHRGLVKGEARIILSANDFHKFRAGEILVTSMTRPEFIPLVKKSIAVITDEGGITCHAAIISRELKIPCIIGTKIVTKVLKDGMMVEVDANNGIIKIIK
jgi:phosphohistidine swiveling domain-containing protein